MLNPMLEKLTNQSQINPQFSNAIEMLKSAQASGNPEQALMNIVSRNPQYSNIMSIVRQSGITPKGLFYMFARQQGVDPELLLNALKQ